MKNERCYFIENSKRCDQKRTLFSIFCEKHKDCYKKYDNKTLLKQLSESIRKCIYITVDKKIAPVKDMRIWGEFNNIFNELISRGYEYTEIRNSFSSIMKDEKIFDDIYKEIKYDPKWLKFEKIVAEIHKLKATGATIKFNDYVIGKNSKSKRQLDITIKFEHSFYKYFAVIECKDHSNKISIGIIEALKTKLDDVGANKGIIVSAKGFQEGAIEASKSYGIDLFTLTEEKTEWIEKVKESIINIPFPSEIKFNHMTDGKIFVSIGKKVKFDAILFHKNQYSKPITLGTILKDLCIWAKTKNVQLPVWIEVKFENEMYSKFSEEKYYPVYGIDVLLEEFSHKSSKKIDIAPKIMNYVYSDILYNKEIKIPFEEISKKL